MNDSIINRIKKLRSVALHGGTESERLAAQLLFDKLVDKYKLQDTDLDDCEITSHEFTYSGEHQLILLHQIIYKITNSSTVYKMRNIRSGRLSRSRICADCTAAQKAEIDFLFDFYNTLWNDEVKYLRTAFIIKHSLWGDPDEDSDNGSDLSATERLKIHQFLQGLSDSSPVLRITSQENT